VLNATGFLAMLAAYTGVVRPSYGSMARAAPRARGRPRRCALTPPPAAPRQVLFTAVGFGGNGAMLLPGLVTSLGNFPEIRGMVTGLLKSVFFLCASIYTEARPRARRAAPRRLRGWMSAAAAALTRALRAPWRAQWDLELHQRTDWFLLLLAVLPAAASLACIPFLKHLPKKRVSGGSASAAAAAAGAEGLATRRTFFAASGLTLGIALYMACTVMLQSERPKTFLPLVPVAFAIMVTLLGFYASLPAINRLLTVRALRSRARCVPPVTDPCCAAPVAPCAPAASAGGGRRGHARHAGAAAGRDAQRVGRVRLHGQPGGGCKRGKGAGRQPRRLAGHVAARRRVALRGRRSQRHAAGHAGAAGLLVHLQPVCH
jgi:hypothetical protein